MPATIVLAIWGRETDFGRYTLPYDGVRVLATQAYVGRRKDKYRNEFILALKMIGDGEVTRKDLRVSWAGATGLTQFLPSEFYQHAVDFDGDGRKDIWHSVPDALASAAEQLVNKGWQKGVRWAYEVKAPANVDCTMGVPEVTKPIGEWLRAGFVPCAEKRLSAPNGAAGLAVAAWGCQFPAGFLNDRRSFSWSVSISISMCSSAILPNRMSGHSRDAVVGLDPSCAPPMSKPCSAASRVSVFYADKVDGKASIPRRARRSAPSRRRPPGRR